MARWTSEDKAILNKYRAEDDPKSQGFYYVWERWTDAEGDEHRSGFGMRVHRTGRRTWQQCGMRLDQKTGRRQPYFKTLGVVGEMSLKEARGTAVLVKSDAKRGVDRREDVPATPNAQPATTPALTAEQQAAQALAATTLRQAINYYDNQRNCAPVSKYVLVKALEKHVADWLEEPLLQIAADPTRLQARYKKVLAATEAKGRAYDAKLVTFSAKDRLLRTTAGYYNGIDTANRVATSFGTVYTYWTCKHAARLQKAGILVPPSPTIALIDDRLDSPRRVKPIPDKGLITLIRSLGSYKGNKLHPLLFRLLLATGQRVGILMNCKWEYVYADCIIIPAKAGKSKVRWRKRHLEHLAKVIPITSTVRQILKELKAVGPQYGDSKTWLFPSREAKSGHMEEESAACLGLREHSGVRFTCHQIRHNVGTAAGACGYTTREVGELIDHTEKGVTDRYIEKLLARKYELLKHVDAWFAKLMRTGKAPKPVTPFVIRRAAWIG